MVVRVTEKEFFETTIRSQNPPSETFMNENAWLLPE